MKIGRFIINFLARRLEKGNKERRDKYNHLVPEFAHRLDVPFIDDNKVNHQLDVFLAKKDNRKDICLIDIHGGAYIFGTHRDNFQFGYEFLKEGYDFVSLDYLPNNGKMDVKELIDDCYKSLRYVFDRLKEFGLEKDRFVITGDSAGGHFALLIAEISQNIDLQKEFGYDLEDVHFEAVLVNSPVYDLNLAQEGLTKSGSKRMFGPRFNDKAYMSFLSPVTYLKRLNMPIFLSTCKNDFIRKHSLMLKKDAEELHLDLDFLDIISTNKGVHHVHNITNPPLKESKVVNKAMISFIDKSLN